MSAQRLVDALLARHWVLATAESCTGGLVAAAITDIAGASAVLDRGFVTYSNMAKTEMLKVPAELITEFGAVSEQVARAMAEGALKASNANVSVAVTGIAGPAGGSISKPVGLVHFACATTTETRSLVRIFSGMNRTQVRQAAVDQAILLVLEAL